MVCKPQYALEEDCTGKDFDRQQPLSLSLRRGMKVNMSMQFDAILHSVTPRTCPRCKAENDCPDGMTIQLVSMACEPCNAGLS
jgi:hypothetical protein